MIKDEPLDMIDTRTISDLKPGDIFINHRKTRVTMPTFPASNNVITRDMKFGMPQCATVITLEKAIMPDLLYGDVRVVYHLTYFMDGRIIKKFYDRNVLLTKCLFQLIS